MPLEQERRGGWEGQRHEHGWERGELGSLSQPMCALGTLPLWGPHLAALGAVADEDFPFGVCPFLVSPTPRPCPLLVSLSILFPSLGFPLFSPSLSDLSPLPAPPLSAAPTNSPPHQAAS